MKENDSKTIHRRQFIRMACLAISLVVLAACEVKPPQTTPMLSPTVQVENTATPANTITATPPPTETVTPEPTPTVTSTNTPTLSPTPEYTPMTTYSTDFEKFYANPKESFIPMSDDLAYNLARTTDQLAADGVLPPFPKKGTNPIIEEESHWNLVDYAFNGKATKDDVYPKFGIYVHSEYKGMPVIIASMRKAKYDPQGNFIEEKSISVIYNIQPETKQIFTEYNSGLLAPIIIVQNNGCTDDIPSAILACKYDLPAYYTDEGG